MVAALPSVLSPGDGPAGQPARLIQRIAVATLPVVVVGLLFNDFIEETLRTPRVAAWALAIGAVVMFGAERLGTRRRTEDSVTWLEAVLIGCAQACALIPGVSRSGATISLGMFLGFRRDAAARFTFLLAIPATLAAAGKESIELGHMGVTAANAQLMIIGVLVSAIVGYVTINTSCGSWPAIVSTFSRTIAGRSRRRPSLVVARSGQVQHDACSTGSGAISSRASSSPSRS